LNNRLLRAAHAVAASVLASVCLVPAAHAQENRLCDPGVEQCRTYLLNYIANERVGIDVGFWFMEDSRYTDALIKRWQAGVPVRVLVDPRANATNQYNAGRLLALKNAGIPMRERFTGGILHYKMMLFAGQNIVEFSGANYSADAWTPAGAPLLNYTDEAIFFTGAASIVNSFRTKFDDLWVSTNFYRDYANVPSTRSRVYETYPIDQQLNFVPAQSYANRALGRYSKETQKIDVIMYRITDRRHTDAMIAAHARGVQVRLITEPQQYRDVVRLWHSWNVDRMYLAGIPIMQRKHAGLNHQKSVLLYGLKTTMYGSSNWSSASGDSQEEHNMFSTDPVTFKWFVDQFERKWYGSAGVVENEPFVPLPPTTATTPNPAHLAAEVATSTPLTVKWYGGPWAHLYDVYLGTNAANLPMVAANLELGPSESPTAMQKYVVASPLLPGTTYYWKIVSRTMANLTRTSSTWSFTTAGAAPAPSIARLVREPYLQQVTATTAVIVWATREAGPAELWFGQPGAPRMALPAASALFSAAQTGMAFDYYQHVARLTGLTPLTDYQYDIIVSGLDLNSVIDTFRTAPARGTGNVSFVAFGDSGTGSLEQRQIASLIQNESFDLVLHSGDLAYGAGTGTGPGTFQTTHDWFFTQYKNWLRARPVFPVNGNHDSRADNGNGAPYLGLFVLPENGATATYPDHAERYYSFDYGPIHIVALDTEFAFLDPGRQASQLAWLEADLAATPQPWKIALFHRPPYSAGGEHGSQLDVRAALTPIFERYGVQLAIGGHEHDYERTVPLRAGSPDPTGVTYLVTGGGGAPLYPSGTGTWTAASASRFHYMRGMVTACTLQVSAVGDDGIVFDSVSIARCTPAVDSVPPVVTMTAPAGAAIVRGVTGLSANATDNVRVSDTQFFVDGVAVGHDSVAPFVVNWDATTASNGAHVLTVSATDAASNTTMSAEVGVIVSNPTPGPGDVVLYAAEALPGSMVGRWQRETDLTAAGGVRLRNPNANAAKRTAALAAPIDYFEMTFTAPANVPYHLWVRGKADSNNYANDSVFVQFSDVTTNRIGTTAAAEMNLEDCSGCGVAGWGWQDNGYGTNVIGSNVVFTTSGVHTIRIQVREDGLSIDQIVLSPSKFLAHPPGAAKNDANVYPRTTGEAPPPPDTESPTAIITSPAVGAVLSGKVAVTVSASDNVGITGLALLVDDLPVAAPASGPFTLDWDTGTASDNDHTLTVRVRDAAGNETVTAAVIVTVSNSAPPQPAVVVLYTADVPAGSVFGKWRQEADPSAAAGSRLRHPDANAAKRTTALATPADYFDVTFTAEANVPYHLWIRSRGDANSWANDSVFVQFSNVAGALIGTTGAWSMNLEDCSNCGIAGWGWQDNGYGVVGADLVFTQSGPQIVRIQTREDGIAIDQIVLSPLPSRTAAPGTLKNDATIVAR
jgi:phosphatidylserine/phosphatidylglycerophosphate/cardiolipin synthase-like enzyme